MLNRFARWFASAAGVWQTVFICLAWVGAEKVFPSSDPNGLILLYVLTIYSAVTQPILAYSNRLDTEQGAVILKHLGEVLDRVATMEAAILEDTEAIQNTPSKEN
jgi:hypothetical protein